MLNYWEIANGKYNLYHLTLIRITTIKKKQNKTKNIDEGVEKTTPLYTAGEYVGWHSNWKPVRWFCFCFFFFSANGDRTTILSIYIASRYISKH